MAKVSIIIPVYNVEKYLRQCLDSVVNQTLRDIEIICVDDGSTDGSPAILAEYAARDSRIKVVARAHSNAGAARNAGMAIACGEYLAFVDSDDWCELTLCEKAYAAAKTNGAELVFWRYALFDAASGEVRQEGLFETEYKRETALLSYSLAPWSRLVSRELVCRAKISFQEIVRSNDVYFGGMTMMVARTASLVDEVLYNYRTGMSSNLQANNAQSPCAVVDAWQLLVEEWRKRALEIPERVVYSAAWASLSYTLGSIREGRAYDALWKAVKAASTCGGIFESVKAESLSNERLRETWADLQFSKTAFEYLVCRQSADSRRLSSALGRSKACERELAMAQKARRINWQEVQVLTGKLAAKEDECQRSLCRVAEFESSFLCRLSLSLVRRLKRVTTTLTCCK